MADRDDVNIKTFNTAKKYSDEILFSMMSKYQSYQRQSDFGCENLEDSTMLNNEIRDIQRYNGLKAMNDILLSLLTTISSTIILKGNKEETEQLELLIKQLEKIKLLFYDNKSLFFNSKYDSSGIKEELDRIYFEKVKKIVQTCYINTEILMTRNKLLFSDASDEFKSDEETKEEIMKRYIEG